MCMLALTLISNQIRPRTGFYTKRFLYVLRVCFSIVNRGELVGRPVNIKEENKQMKIYVKRSLLTLHIFCFMLIDYA